jgi:two-component system, OmpR family, response regulator
MKNILIVEDDVDISNMLCEMLTQNGFAPTAAYSGSEAILRLGHERFDLVLLDLMLPGKTGLKVLEEFRAKSNVPVIVLTAVSDKDSIIKLLRTGSDDYLTKPFDNGELLARIEVQLRKIENSEKKSELVYKDLSLDLETFDAYIHGIAAGLSKTEFTILKILMSHPKKVFTKNNLYESVWGGEFLGDDNTINVHISKLRSKLAEINPNGEYIQTVWGIGFKMKE